MWLTRVLLGKQKPPRRLYSGKHRIPFILTMRMKRELLQNLAYEDENLFYLRQPYLTEEQERGYTAELGKGKAKMARIQDDRKLQMMKKHVYLEDRLEHLRYSGAWE